MSGFLRSIFCVALLTTSLMLAQTAKTTVFIKDGTAAWAHVVHDKCPGLNVVLRPEFATFVLEVAIEPDAGQKADWAVYDANGLLVTSGHTLKWDNSAKDGCEAVLKLAGNKR